MLQGINPTGYVINNHWSFGSNALLSKYDLGFLWRMLECRNCRLRLIYQTLAAKEVTDSDTLEYAPLKPRHHFHKLSRLVEAVNVATHKQTTLYRSAATSCVINRSRSRPAYLGRETKVRTMRVRHWICNHHATDLFRYLFYAAEDAVDTFDLSQIHASSPSRWAGVVFPKGQTDIYDKGLSQFERTRSVPNFRPVLPHLTRSASFSPLHTLFSDASKPSLYDLPFSSCDTTLLQKSLKKRTKHGTAFALSLKKESLSGDDPETEINEALIVTALSNKKDPSLIDIADANRRWSNYYDDPSRRPREVSEKAERNVHFPVCHVTGVLKARCYENPANLLRSDRTWEWCHLDRVREGGSPSDIECDKEMQAARRRKAGAKRKAIRRKRARYIIATYGSNVPSAFFTLFFSGNGEDEDKSNHEDASKKRRKRRKKRKSRCDCDKPSIVFRFDMWQDLTLSPQCLEALSSLLCKKLYAPLSCDTSECGSDVSNEVFIEFCAN